MSKFSEHIASLAGKLKETLVTETNGTTLKMSHEGNVYTENLPEGITQELARKVHEYDVDITMALTHAAGQVAIENFTTNGDLTDATYTAKLDTNKLEVSFDRSKTFQVPPKDGGEPSSITKNCNTTVKFVARAGRNSDLDHIRTALVEMASEAYGSK